VYRLALNELAVYLGGSERTKQRTQNDHSMIE
jgi:hypothetical protein